MKPVRILADENIPYVEQVFRSLGEVRTMSGRAITAAAVRDVDLLLVRSVTRVDNELLETSRVRFVATATIGFDHIDLDYLARHKIAFSAAPGSNAQSVAEYVVAALVVLEGRGRVDLARSTLGIVGVGHVGKRVDWLARALGMETLLNDPPRARAEGSEGFVDLETLCRRADVVTFHVPLTREGPDATWHLLDETLIGRLRRGITVLNTSRGGVHDTAALGQAKRSGQIRGLVLDVFEHEPAIDPELGNLADLSTPHIAGYTQDGKVAGTRMIFEAACRFLGRSAEWPRGVPPRVDLACRLEHARLGDAVRAAYDIERDDANLRNVLGAPAAADRARGFDQLRKDYPRRYQFARWRIELGAEAAPLRPSLEGLGFDVSDAR